MIKKRSIAFLAAALATAGATTAICFGDALHLVPANAAVEASAIDPAPVGMARDTLSVLEKAKPWLAGPASAAPALRGKVVVVNFWTYSCINSLRALPYLRAWSDRYARDGLVVIGVHAPEFGFEKDTANVQTAIAQLGVRYPNVQDNAYATWQKFSNQGWPGIYFIDATGSVRGYRLGEGDYAAGEQLIRKLLAEAGRDPGDSPLARIEGSGVQAEADWPDLRSPEAYVGYGKTEGFSSPEAIHADADYDYSATKNLLLNHWDYAGRWRVGREFATLVSPGGAIRFRFHARDAHLVLGGASQRQPIRFRVTIDGAAPGANHGTDVDAAGWGALKEDRLYQLVRQNGPVSTGTLRIEFASRARGPTFLLLDEPSRAAPRRGPPLQSSTNQGNCDMARTWLVTGSSRGFGRALCESIIEAGDNVLATARDPSQLEGLVAKGAGRVAAAALDVTNAEQADAAVGAAIDRFGALDVLVNNAGYGNIGSVEDTPLDSFRQQIETNLFGTIIMTKAALAHMRERRSGHIIQFSSVGGRLGAPGRAPYSAAKWGVEGFSEVLAQEMRLIGVRVTIIEPGGFRTDFAGTSTALETGRAEYDEVVGRAARMQKAYDGQQPGDPRKGAQAILTVVNSQSPPLRLALGSDALAAIEQSDRARLDELQHWRTLSASTDIAAPAH